MIECRSAVFRLYPTIEQAAEMAQIAGACRFVYNLALEQRRDWSRKGRNISFVTQCREVTQLRAEVDWLKAAPVHALQQSIRDLDRAFQNFFAGRASFPKMHRKGVNDSFRFPDPTYLTIERTGLSAARVKLPKLGWVRLRRWRSLPGSIKNMTISRRCGKWFASVSCERQVEDARPSSLPAVGIDMGIATFASLSDGSTIPSVNYGKAALSSLRRASRSLARKKLGSANRRKAARRVARLQQKIANARKDFLQKQSTIVANSHGMIVMEALSIRSMSASAAGTLEAPGKMVRQKSGLNRAILDQGWRHFRTLLRYKTMARGSSLVEVPAAYTSQTCPRCGVIDASNRKSQASFACVQCDYAGNADTTAAINILRRADSALKPVEAHRPRRPYEAGTRRHAAPRERAVTFAPTGFGEDVKKPVEG